MGTSGHASSSTTLELFMVWACQMAKAWRGCGRISSSLSVSSVHLRYVSIIRLLYLSHLIPSANTVFGSSIVMLALLPKIWLLTLEIGSGTNSKRVLRNKVLLHRKFWTNVNLVPLNFISNGQINIPLSYLSERIRHYEFTMAEFMN